MLPNPMSALAISETARLLTALTADLNKSGQTVDPGGATTQPGGLTQPGCFVGLIPPERGTTNYFFSSAACAAARRAIGTRNGEQLT